MKIKRIEKTISVVVWESKVDGDVLVEVYPCDTLEVAQTKVQEFKNWVLSEGHFSDINAIDCEIVNDDNDRYFIMDNIDDYWEDIYIKTSKLFIEDK